MKPNQIKVVLFFLFFVNVLHPGLAFASEKDEKISVECIQEEKKSALNRARMFVSDKKIEIKNVESVNKVAEFCRDCEFLSLSGNDIDMEFLCSHADYEIPWSPYDDIFFPNMPCARALSKMGNKAIYPLVISIAKEKNDSKRRVLGDILKSLCRHHISECKHAKYIVSGMLVDATEEERKKLHPVLMDIKQWEKTFENSKD